MKNSQAGYNPFNSWKNLIHSAHFRAILAAEETYEKTGKAEFSIRPPIIVNFDPTNKCNYNCRFCMFGGARDRADITGQTYRADHNASLPKGYALKLPRLWKEWGIKAECCGGGGDPTMHPDSLEHVIESANCGIDVGFVSNGYLVNNAKWWDALSSKTVFTGFSIDAGTPEDYAAVKGVPAGWFDVAINNLFQIAEAKKRNGGKCTTGYKFLLDEYNWKSIYKAAKIASQIGCSHFQFRPAINPNYAFFRERAEEINGQIEQAQKDFDREDFEVIGTTHKFNPDFTKRHAFDKCRATMLSTTWCANGKVYMCTDTRGNPWAYLIDHHPNPEKVIEYWGSKEHWDKISKINFRQDCDRCTLGPQNEFFEQVFLKDKLQMYLI